MDLRKYADIGFNLVDPMFKGIYRGKRNHENDLAHVLKRARDANVARIIAIAGSLSESQETIAFCNEYERGGNSGILFATVGCHPTRTVEFERHEFISEAVVGSSYIDELRRLILRDKKSPSPKVVAFGEMGLDYDRLHFSPLATQKRYFRMQLDLAKEFDLPLYLHDRNSAGDFYDIMSESIHHFSRGGVLHSFTGSLDYMHKITKNLGLYIGVNGCSLKTQENLEVVKSIPLDKLLIETDAPWCNVRSSHESFKLLEDFIPDPQSDGLKGFHYNQFRPGNPLKNRNEPCYVRQIYHIVAKLRDMNLNDLMDAVYKNTLRLLFPNE